MTAPFDKCSTLGVTSGRVQCGEPNTANLPRDGGTFEGAGRLFLVVTKARKYINFRAPSRELLPPQEVNRILAELGVSVRVDSDWKPYVEDDSGD